MRNRGVTRARLIATEFEYEAADRLESIFAELGKAQHPEFWEIIDRGQNFDYLPPKLHEQLAAFRKITSGSQLEIEV